MSTALAAGIVTDDPEPLVRFYERAMGFVVESASTFPQGSIHRLRRDDARLKLYAPADGVERPAPPEPWFRDAGFAYAALLVDDAAAIAAQVAAAGGTVITEPSSHRPGAVYSLVADPEGNVWEILQDDGDAV